jgi:hypothetical protein
MKEIRWWTAEEIDAANQTEEKIFPEGLAAWVHKLRGR